MDKDGYPCGIGPNLCDMYYLYLHTGTYKNKNLYSTAWIVGQKKHKITTSNEGNCYGGTLTINSPKNKRMLL